MAKTDLKRLKKRLPAKWAKTINGRIGFSRSYICKVMDGEKENLDIIRAAKQLADEYARERRELGIPVKK